MRGCFGVERGPHGGECENALESEARLAEEGEQPGEAMVGESEKTVSEKREMQEYGQEIYDYIFQVSLNADVLTKNIGRV